ncbi:MAG: leucine-rich repeat protein [Clostridia bacterium]|nr:leucine-rich repeat protein [Clostridia bacterium]
MKKAYRKILCLILSAVMIIGIMPALELKTVAASQVYTSEDGKWMLKTITNDTYAYLYRYLGNDIDVVIPEEIDGYKIAYIDSFCFYGQNNDSYNSHNAENIDSIKSIYIPSSVEYINSRAFVYMDSLERIEFDESRIGTISFGAEAFCYSPQLKYLKIPDYCDYSGSRQFLKRSYIKELEVPSIPSNYTFGGFPLEFNPVEKVTIAGDYSFGSSRAVFGSDSLNTVEIKGDVDGKNISVDLDADQTCTGVQCGIRKPDFILHHIPSPELEKSFEELGYIKKYDYDTGITTYSVNETPDTTYSPTVNENNLIDEYHYGDFDYALTASGNAVITAYHGDSDRISFPQGVDGHTVTALGADGYTINTGNADSIIIPDTVEYIAKSAFEGNSALKYVDFSDNLKIIESQAFKACSLKEVILPDVVYVGPEAFQNCLPEKVYIPGTLKEVSSKMFYANKSAPVSYFNEVTISEGVEAIGYRAFNLTSISDEDSGQFELSLPSTLNYIGESAFEFANVCGELVIPQGVKKLSDCAFIGNKFNSVTLPQGLEYIGVGCFMYSSLTTNLVIPETVIKLGDEAFYQMTAPEIDLPESISVIPALCFDSSDIGRIIVPEGCKEIEDDAFSYSVLGELSLPESLELADSKSFREAQIDNFIYGCKDLDPTISITVKSINNLTITETVRKLPNGFLQHNRITGNIIVQPGVETIGKYAFYKTNIEEINLPETVKSIGYKAFADTQLKHISVPNSVTNLGKGAFANNELLESVDFFANSCIIAYDDAYPFENCPNLKEFNFDSSVKYIPDNLLRNSGVESISIPEGVTDIGAYAFAGTNLKSIVLPDSIESMGDGCFENCKELETAVINSNIMLIGDNTFRGCDKLREIYIADSVMDIGRTSFSGCTSLETVYMSKNVVYIPERCFENCTALSSFTWESDSKLIGKLAFSGCTSLTVFDFTGIAKLYPNSFQGSGIGVASLGEARNEAAAALQVVEAQSFMSCPELQTVALGGNVNTVQTKAFANCENLETAIISDSVETIAPDAFENCPKLTIYCSESSYAYNYATSNDIKVSTFVVEPIPNQKYTGRVIEPEVKVSLSGNPLARNEDFRVRYTDNVNVGTATAKVSGINGYKMFTSTVNFAIISRNISEAEIGSIADQSYKGGEVTPKVKVTYNGKTLREGTDYNVIYTSNESAGTAKATIIGTGNYSGTHTVTFNIVESPAGDNPADEPGNNPEENTSFIRTVLNFFMRIIAAFRNLFAGFFTV